MLISVDPHSGVPVYRQLMDQIKFHVASGLLKPGEELPSTRSLSSDLGVNPMTISKAYSFLEKEGVVERRPGRPLVVRALETSELEDTKIDRLRVGLSPVVRMVRQLGIDSAEAVHTFGEMLDSEGGAPSREREGDEA